MTKPGITARAFCVSLSSSCDPLIHLPLPGRWTSPFVCYRISLCCPLSAASGTSERACCRVSKRVSIRRICSLSGHPVQLCPPFPSPTSIASSVCYDSTSGLIEYARCEDDAAIGERTSAQEMEWNHTMREEKDCAVLKQASSRPLKFPRFLTVYAIHRYENRHSGRKYT